MVATPDSPWGVNLKDYALTKAKRATCGIILLQCRIAICCLKNRDAAGDSPTNKGKDRGGTNIFLMEGALGEQTADEDNLDMVMIFCCVVR